MKELDALARLLHQRNQLDLWISKLIGRPAMTGHLGEFIASKIFGIKLMESASHKGIDGHFTTGNLAKCSVNIKLYSERQGLLDIPLDGHPDYFLVLTGSKSKSSTSKGQTRSFVIESVFLFDTHTLVPELERAGIKIGIATSVKQQWWTNAEIYPIPRNPLLIISEEQRNLLELFGSRQMFGQ